MKQEQEYYFAYLDLLGFSNKVKKSDGEDIANTVLKIYKDVFDTKRKDAAICPDIPEYYKVDAFEYFLPFSDCIFIASKSADEFIKQLGGFLCYCAFNYERGDGKQAPTYTPLFKGGLAFGTVKQEDMPMVIKGKPYNTIVLIGKPVIEAVELAEKNEKLKGAGPRVFCRKEFIDKLFDETKNMFAQTTEDSNIFEFLWPSMLFQSCKLNSDPLSALKNTFGWCYFKKIVDLLNSKENEGKEEIYIRFLELLIVSVFNFHKKEEYIHDIFNLVIDLLKGHKLSNIIDVFTIPDLNSCKRSGYKVCVMRGIISGRSIVF